MRTQRTSRSAIPKRLVSVVPNRGDVVEFRFNV